MVELTSVTVICSYNFRDEDACRSDQNTSDIPNSRLMLDQPERHALMHEPYRQTSSSQITKSENLIRIVSSAQFLIYFQRVINMLKSL
jgi:hypothetical protein